MKHHRPTPSSNARDAKPLWNTREFSAHMRWKDDGSAARRLRWSGRGPRYIKRGRRVLYDPSDVAAWLEAMKRTSTSDRGPR